MKVASTSRRLVAARNDPPGVTLEWSAEDMEPDNLNRENASRGSIGNVKRPYVLVVSRRHLTNLTAWAEEVGEP